MARFGVTPNRTQQGGAEFCSGTGKSARASEQRTKGKYRAMKGRNMASLESDFFPEVEETLIIEDDGPVQPEDALVNTKGASLNYTKWDAAGPYCADKSSFVE